MVRRARRAFDVRQGPHGREHGVRRIGPFLRLEEHPISKGVFRALFDDSLNTGSGPDSEKFIAFGSELQGAVIESGRLVLDKGAQTIEIVDGTSANATPTADEVTWAPQAAPPAAAPAVVPPPPLPPPASSP